MATYNPDEQKRSATALLPAERPLAAQSTPALGTVGSVDSSQPLSQLATGALRPPAPPQAAPASAPSEYGRQMANVGNFFVDIAKHAVGAPGYGVNSPASTPAPAAPVPALPKLGTGAPGSTGDARRLANDYDRTTVPAPPKSSPPPVSENLNGFEKTSIDDVYRRGNAFSDAAGLNDNALWKRGAISPQNEAAADALAGRYGAIASAAAREPAAPPLGLGARARMSTASALNDLRSPEAIALRNAAVGGATRSSYNALFNELTAGARQAQTAEMQDAGATQRALIQESGALGRTAIQENGQMTRAGMTNEVQRGELDVKRGEFGVRSRAARQIQEAQQAYLGATTPEARARAAQNLRVLSGNGEDVSAKDRYIRTGGGQSVIDGSTVREPERIFDTVTRQYVDAARDINSDPKALAIKNDAKLSRAEKAAQLQQLGY